MPYLSPETMYQRQRATQPVDPGFWGSLLRTIPAGLVAGGAAGLGTLLGGPVGAGVGAAVGGALGAPVQNEMAKTLPTETVDVSTGEMSPLARTLAARKPQFRMPRPQEWLEA